ncbi:MULTISPECIES: 2'-deoxycytidine 5'-triphosphate deaminase [unclassified Nitrospina]|uniref:2'-deoxycytidine 5'-triphosphate deaminase n=1 Tax=unclassified Nitrospina TaxID=2638683 RepID=UPI003F9ABDD1
MKKLTAKSLVKTSLQQSLKGKSGYLTDREIELAYHQGIIHTPRTLYDSQIQPVSLDLRLGQKAYRIQSSFLPENETVEKKLKDLKLYEVDLRDGGILEKGAIYLIPLLEELDLPTSLFGCTNPKSSTGRLDMFTRVIIDRGHRFDEIAPGYKGKLYLEVLSRSFPVRVQEGISLNQLRLKQGNAEITDRQLQTLYKKKPILYHKNGGAVDWDKVKADDGLFISVDLQGTNRKNSIVAYKAKANSQVVDLSKTNHYHADDFWEPVYYSKKHRLILEPESFYIMMSKEKICIWPDLVSEMVAYEPNSGELRTHYAGFFDPGFGWHPGKGAKSQGTRAVMEVRPHDVPFMIEDGQTFCRMKFERIISEPTRLYGKQLQSHYHTQELSLSKYFKN